MRTSKHINFREAVSAVEAAAVNGWVASDEIIRICNLFSIPPEVVKAAVRRREISWDAPRFPRHPERTESVAAFVAALAECKPGDWMAEATAYAPEGISFTGFESWVRNDAPGVWKTYKLRRQQYLEAAYAKAKAMIEEGAHTACAARTIGIGKSTLVRWGLRSGRSRSTKVCSYCK